MFLKNKFRDFQEDVVMAGQTTFRIGGPARYFLTAQTKEELLAAVEWAKNNRLNFFILGGGSNVLVSDKGFNGLVIKYRLAEIRPRSIEMSLDADAGVPLAEIVSESINLGWGGLEWALGIPGTLGGAVCGNAGRLGRDMAQLVQRVVILDEDLAEKEILAADCEFNYRFSRFKRRGEIILSAVLRFSLLDADQSEKILREAKSVVERMPDFPSAGSVFKNYLIDSGDELIKKHPEFQEKIRGGKLAVGFLIQQCGLAGKRIGGAQIWEKHANFILNVDNAKAEDVVALIALARQSVEEKFGVRLEEEIRTVGF